MPMVFGGREEEASGKNALHKERRVKDSQGSSSPRRPVPAKTFPCCAGAHSEAPGCEIISREWGAAIEYGAALPEEAKKPL